MVYSIFVIRNLLVYCDAFVLNRVVLDVLLDEHSGWRICVQLSDVCVVFVPVITKNASRLFDFVDEYVL